MIGPRYLGDGVYASSNGFHIVLTTGHHLPLLADNTIYLEPFVYRALQMYIADGEKESSNEQSMETFQPGEKP